MATEQALYSLVAANRAANNKNSLYRMSDTTQRDAPNPVDSAGLPGKHTDIRKTEVISPGRSYGDIQGHANQVAIEALAARGIITGRGGDSFDPDTAVTRAEFAAIITRALGLPVKSTTVFTDVPAASWYAAPIATAHYYEIFSGESAVTFNPNGMTTRQEATTVTARAARLCGMKTERSTVEIRDSLAGFGDYRTVADWAQPSMAFCYDTGILDDSEFDIKPLTAARRCEIAEIVYRLLDRANLL